MFLHVSLGSNEIVRAREFYDPLMLLIGLRVLKASDSAVSLWIFRHHFQPGDADRRHPGDPW